MLNSNEETQYLTRELKSVFTDCHSLLLKIVVHAPHDNLVNPKRQVGIVAINCLGTINSLPNSHSPLLPLRSHGFNSVQRARPNTSFAKNYSENEAYETKRISLQRSH